MLTIREYTELSNREGISPPAWYRNEEIEYVRTSPLETYGWVKIKGRPTDVIIAADNPCISIDPPIQDGYPEQRERLIEMIELLKEELKLTRDAKSRLEVKIEENVLISHDELANLQNKAYYMDEFMRFMSMFRRYSEFYNEPIDVRSLYASPLENA